MTARRQTDNQPETREILITCEPGAPRTRGEMTHEQQETAIAGLVRLAGLLETVEIPDDANYNDTEIPHDLTT